MANCPHCGARLEQPSSCAACGTPLAVPEGTTPYALFGLEPRYDVDVKDLRKRLLAISRTVHPDYFGTAAPDVRARAEQNSARLNAAFETLADEAARAEWLVTHLGGPDAESERAMPQAFLADVLEWNETLEEARADAGRLDPRVESLARDLAARRAQALSAVRGVLEPLPPRAAPQLRRARAELNAVRYVDRALTEIEGLRLARAARR